MMVIDGLRDRALLAFALKSNTFFLMMWEFQLGILKLPYVCTYIYVYHSCEVTHSHPSVAGMIEYSQSRHYPFVQMIFRAAIIQHNFSLFLSTINIQDMSKCTHTLHPCIIHNEPSRPSQKCRITVTLTVCTYSERENRNLFIQAFN